MTAFTVTNLLDAGKGSLRQAILDANANEGTDTLNFAPGLSGTINLTNGELLITDSLEILGPGADMLTVDAQQNSRVFNIDSGASTVTLRSLTITGGRTTTNESDDGHGAGIRSRANLTIIESIVSGNTTSGDRASGGGISNLGGNLTITNTTVSNNITSSTGGGVYSRRGSELIVTNSTISDNAAASHGGGIRSSDDMTLTNSTVSRNASSGAGGGIYIAGSRLTITNSTISDNTAVGGSGWGGGGILDGGGPTTIVDSIVSGNSTSGVGAEGGGINSRSATRRGELTLISSTVSGNSTTGEISNGGGVANGGKDLTIINSTVAENSTSGTKSSGGGIFSRGGFSSRKFILTNSTITSNTASGKGAYGGGIDLQNAQLTADSSIIAGNTAASGPDISLYLRASLSGSNNLIGIGDNTGVLKGGFANGVDSNLVGTSADPLNPRLGPLQGSGDPLPTQSPLPDSPAIDMGSNSQELTTDQRGSPRSVGQTDIGAVEVQAVQPKSPNLVPEPNRAIYPVLIGLVFFTFIGTVLGRQMLQRRR